MLICGFMGLSHIHQGKKLNRKTGCGMTVKNLREKAWFWTSTIFDKDSVRTVSFWTGYDDVWRKSNDSYVMCVR